MAKKKGGGEGGANWMDTYGDMVTLLLCFFVLLYSMSTISEEKFKAIVQSFNPNAVQTETDPKGEDGPYADPDIGNENPGMNEQQEDIDDMMEQLMAALEAYTKQEGIESAVSVSQDGGEIYLKLSDRAMFDGNSDVLRPEAREMLVEICGMLDSAKGAIDQIRVEGHTAQQYDNQPNETPGDRRLASSRATEVTIFIQDNSTIHPARICSVGWGQWHAIANNQGEAGKAPNRRVELVISARDLESEELGESLSKFVTDGNTSTPANETGAPSPASSAEP